MSGSTPHVTDFFPSRKTAMQPPAKDVPLDSASSSASHGVSALAAAAAIVSGSSTTIPKTNALMFVHHSTHQDLCQRLNLDSDTLKRSWNLLYEIYQKQIDQTSQMDDLWLQICAIWTGGRLNAHETDTTQVDPNGISLNQLLDQVPNSNMIDFFVKVKLFIETHLDHDHKETMRKQLDSTQKNYTTLASVYNRFKSEFSNMFQGDVATSPFLTDLFKFTWLLFLLMRDAVLAKGANGFDKSFVVMLLVLNLMVAQESNTLTCKPAVMAKLHEEHGPRERYTAAAIAGTVKKYFCEAHAISPSNYETLEKKLISKLKKLIQNESIKLAHSRSGGAAESKRAISDLSEIQGLIVDVAHNAKQLDREYELQLRACSGIYDARTFWRNELNSIRTPIRTPNMSRLMTSRSPAARSLTPHFNRAYTTAARVDLPLRITTAYQSLADVPSKSLETFFNAVEPSPEADIINRIARLTNWLNEKIPFHQETWSLVPRIYYRALEAMLNREQARLHTTNFSAMLNDVKYHQSLLSCAVEILICAFQIRDITFDDVIKYLQLPPFDVLMTIESFIREEQQNIEGELVLRLKEIEDRILEADAWKEEDPIYNLLLQEQQQQQSLIERSPIRSDLLSSPRRALQAVSFVSTTRMTPSSDVTSLDPNLKQPFKCTKLQFFYRKFYRLVHTRLCELCERLSINKEITQRIWDVLVESLAREGTLRFLYKRHVDTIIMCSIYCVSKIKSPDPATVKFKDIISQYTQLYRFNEAAYKYIFVVESNVPVDIIHFYNNVYLAQVMPVVNMLLNDASEATSPNALPSAPIPQSSPIRVSSRAQLFLDRSRSRRTAAFDSPSGLPLESNDDVGGQSSFEAPRIKNVFSFGEHSPQKKDLQLINSMVAKSTKRLLFPDVPPVASRNGQQQQQQQQQQNGVHSLDAEVVLDETLHTEDATEHDHNDSNIPSKKLRQDNETS